MLFEEYIDQTIAKMAKGLLWVFAAYSVLAYGTSSLADFDLLPDSLQDSFWLLSGLLQALNPFRAIITDPFPLNPGSLDFGFIPIMIFIGLLQGIVGVTSLFLLRKSYRYIFLWYAISLVILIGIFYGAITNFDIGTGVQAVALTIILVAVYVVHVTEYRNSASLVSRDQPNPQDNITPPRRQNKIYIASGAILLLLLGAGAWWYVSLKTPPQESKKETAPQDQTANWKIYQNEKYGFEFKYPQSWTITSPNDEFALYIYNDYEIQFFVEVKNSRSKMGEAIVCEEPITKDIVIASGEKVKVIEQHGCILPEMRDIYGAETLIEAEMSLGDKFVFVLMGTTNKPQDHYDELMEVLKSFFIFPKSNTVQTPIEILNWKTYIGNAYIPTFRYPPTWRVVLEESVRGEDEGTRVYSVVIKPSDNISSEIQIKRGKFIYLEEDSQKGTFDFVAWIRSRQQSEYAIKDIFQIDGRTAVSFVFSGDKREPHTDKIIYLFDGFSQDPSRKLLGIGCTIDVSFSGNVGNQESNMLLAICDAVVYSLIFNR